MRPASSSADPDDCECIVCAVRRGVDRLYPNGVNAAAANEIASDLGGVMGALALKYGTGVMVSFFGAYASAPKILGQGEASGRPQ